MKIPTFPTLAACGLSMLQPLYAAETADTIYHNGAIITINDKQPTVEAIAVKDGKILAVGDLVEINKTAGNSTRKIDLNGKTMLPGFVDSHATPT